MISNTSKPLEPVVVTIYVLDCNNNPVLTDTPFTTIKYNNKYYNGLFFTEGICELSMRHLGNGEYDLTFTPEVNGVYSVTAISEDYKIKKSYIHIVQDEYETSIVVTHETLLDNNNESTAVVDKSGNGIGGVIIHCYDEETKKLEATTQTDILGEWSMSVARGRKVFVFSRDGYNSVSLRGDI